MNKMRLRGRDFMNPRGTLDLTGLNEAQLQAVTHGEGPLLLLAGPGSGKTFTITNRILYLIEKGEAPEGLLVITFTREAALSMQRRFHERCGSIVYPVNFGTFHSCFYHILQKSGAVGAKNIITNSQKKNLLLPVLRQFILNNEDLRQMEGGAGEGLKEDAARILSAVSFYKNTLKYETALKSIPSVWQPHFGAVMTAYGQRVRKEGFIDFDDMLSECGRLLQENAEVRSRWQERFSHILIDEFQDINPVQYKAVKLLAKAPYNIFAVGDDDQAIYGFRGAEPGCLRRFAEEFSARRLLLDINYRSGSEIVGASLAVIGENKNRYEKNLRAAKRDESRIREDITERCGPEGRAGNCGLDGRASIPDGVVCAGFEGREEQYRHMIDALSRSSARGESCAVLFRTNSYMQGFAARLNREGIPYEIREKAVSIYEHFIVRDVVAYLEASQGSADREHFLRIVNKPSRYVSREAVAECGADIKRLKAYYERGDISRAHKTAVLTGLTALERQLKSMGRLSLRLAVEFCLKAAGYERYLRETAAAREGQWQEWREILEWLKGEASQYSDLKQWKEAQEAYGRALAQGAASTRPSGVRADAAGRAGGSAVRTNAEKRKPVQLLTVHGAKGLEFDRVWIPDCNEKIYPYGSLPDSAAVEEERRIFYVAMTRAKKSLELLYLTGTKERPRQPSRFLNPLLYSSGIFDYCSCSLSTSSSNSQLSRYSSKASATFSYSSSSSI